VTQNSLQSYRIVFSKKAEKFLASLNIKNQKKILQKISELKTDRENLDIKKLKSLHNLYRLRIGDFRVVYSIEHEQITIYIVAIGHRRNIYQSLALA
jgi:mRNA interferase RelE/StbE